LRNGEVEEWRNGEVEELRNGEVEEWRNEGPLLNFRTPELPHS
jgi:hypothetical protein